MKHLAKTPKQRAPEAVRVNLRRALQTATLSSYGGPTPCPEDVKRYLDSWCVPALEALVAWADGNEVLVDEDDDMTLDQRLWTPEQVEPADLRRARRAAGHDAPTTCNGCHKSLRACACDEQETVDDVVAGRY